MEWIDQQHLQEKPIAFGHQEQNIISYWGKRAAPRASEGKPTWANFHVNSPHLPSCGRMFLLGEGTRCQETRCRILPLGHGVVMIEEGPRGC